MVPGHGSLEMGIVQHSLPLFWGAKIILLSKRNNNYMENQSFVEVLLEL